MSNAFSAMPEAAAGPVREREARKSLQEIADEPATSRAVDRVLNPASPYSSFNSGI